jgi:acid phosphatase type 7
VPNLARRSPLSFLASPPCCARGLIHATVAAAVAACSANGSGFRADQSPAAADAEPFALLPGDSLRLVPRWERRPSRMTWFSRDTAVATVDSSGLVRGLRFGETRITARSEDLTQDGGTRSATVIVTPPVLVGAGDIASCNSDGDEQTARLLDTIPGIVFTAGDNAYQRGTAAEFARCYGPSWGRHRWRTRPAPGNHDYRSGGARPYFEYFGALAGRPGRGYFSFDLGSWHVVALNSMLDLSIGSPQFEWLVRDLASRRVKSSCVAAIMHHPRFSSGPHGGSAHVYDVWRLLYEQGAAVVLAGHDHLYERFAPQTPRGTLDTARGIREFVVGTGGRSHYRMRRATRNSEVLVDDRFGVLKLALQPQGYRWEFIAAPSGAVIDRGSGSCR